jgi:hypothetical protein
MEKIHIQGSEIIIPDLQYYIQTRNGAKRAENCLKIFLPVFSKGKRPNVLVWYYLFNQKKSVATGTAGERQEGEGQKDESERNRIND